ncbi:MAG: sigma 54-interacting transcriptional regulator [Acidobacteriota bacterium]
MPKSSRVLREKLDSETRVETDSLLLADALRVPGLTILHHPERDRAGDRAALTGWAAGRTERLGRSEPAFAAPGRGGERPLADSHLSRRPIEIRPGKAGGILLVRTGSPMSVEVNGAPLGESCALSEQEIARGAILLLGNCVVLCLSPVDPGAADSNGPFDYGLVGESAPMTGLRREIRRVAATDLPVLLSGETGTGKELVARAIHASGRRGRGPFVGVNMAALPPTLAAAELFGVARGAFTGADRARSGHLRRADGGTLLLDEVGEMPAEVQALLLRALETGEVHPVGGDAPFRVDVRLIAATDADLPAAIAAGRFRAPLLHRLAGYEIRLPPLRARRDDFGRLFGSFVRAEVQAAGAVLDEAPALPARLVAALAAHDWPGNVRELKNAVRRIVLAGLDGGEPAMARQVAQMLEPARASGPERAPSDRTAPERRQDAPSETRRRPEDVGEDELAEALRANRWRIREAADALGIARTSLYERIAKSPSLRRSSDLGADELREALARAAGDLDAMSEALEVSKRGLVRRLRQLGLA